jgi:signal transduction histidine kinase
MYMHQERVDRNSSGRTRNGLARLRHQLVPIVAHELRQPLTAILMALDMVGRDETVARVALDAAKDAARHMSRIIDDVLEVHLDARRRIRLRLAPVDLSAIIHSAIATTRPGLTEKGHQLSMSLPPEPVMFIADSSRLQQVLTNLLTNAVKYTEPGGHIKVTAGMCAEIVVIRVSDNGRGMSQALIARIFQPFQRGEGGGLGLGLALVKSLVELHGGSIAVHSDGPGTGAEFVVHLPAQVPGQRPKRLSF